MKRRRLLKSLAAVPAIPAAAQYSSAGPSPAANSEFPALKETSPEAAAAPAFRLFNPQQAAALSRLAGLILPKSADRPGAIEAGVPQFLDFLLSQSDSSRQALYLNGLDRLNSDSRRAHGKPFAELSPDAAQPLLKPLSEAWTYHSPTDPFARFLREAKDDILQATVNSREFAQSLARRSRSAAGLGAYWPPLD